MTPSRTLAGLAIAIAFFSPVLPAGAADPAGARPPQVKTASTGHVSNYDEAKVGTYTLPDPLVLNDGRPVRDADTWNRVRRPEILELYRAHVFGRVPDNAPKAVAAVESVTPGALGGNAVRKVVVLRFGDGPRAPFIRLVIYIPARRAAKVPVLLHMAFNGEPSPTDAPAPSVPKGILGEPGPISDIVARGFAYAVYRYTDLQPDTADTRTSGVEALTVSQGEAPAPDSWGTIGVWAWGASRALDYLKTDPDIDGGRVALVGHSRLGKAALWAGAQDPRFALVFASCAGEMGTALSRRDFGETVDDMVDRFPYWFAPGFGRYAGHWGDLPGDAHMLIALNAPHPLLVTGGSGDLWADPRGEFLAEVAAGPVYRLLGRKDLGTTQMPALDQDVDAGDLAYRCHTGPHAIMASDWLAFLAFAERYLR